jgi:competence protein ComEA
MLPLRLALAVLLAVLAASAARPWLERPAARSPCDPVGLGTPPRHWLGCAADPGPLRDLAADERLVLGLPIDPNTAGARELAFVPGLGRSLAAEIVSERSRDGPFRDVDDLLRVRGVGPRRLARAREALSIAPGR